ncbi:MAG TPA: hypothetical protein H9871_00010 [Candidatus Nesterenkonia stercoripullorum]|uniref:Uncharacterized protein n=1 Tax=Candidatus Nesterenkonia stercoripullorum TaxID=2838701 RepID=A0A9D1S0H0_9MICC|nr:hypothetical protein [Candidatus Nesterenkonia stercoripullorum]
MAQPFGVGDVVGGRYRITHHVVTSADQDIVFQAHDQVLDREVSILLASRSNAKQVATSARELAVGERDSDAHVLDLGLADDRTYLISALVDPNHLLDLVVPDTAPYVEPFFTDSLGSELFGQSRVMEPETYDDDAEYYAGLHAHRSALPEDEEELDDDAGSRFRRRRPAFLDKVSDSLNKRLGTDRRHHDPAEDSAADDAQAPGEGEGAEAVPAADSPAEADSAAVDASAASSAQSPVTEDPAEEAPVQDASSAAARPSSQRRRSAAPEAGTAAGRAAPAAGLAGAPLTLRSDVDVVDASPSHDTEDTFGVVSSTIPSGGTLLGEDTLSAEDASASEDAPRQDQAPAANSAVSRNDTDAPAQLTPSEGLDGEEVIDDPPAEPLDDSLFAPPPSAARAPLAESADSASAPGAASGSFTGMISPAGEGPAQDAPATETAAAGAAGGSLGGAGAAAPPGEGDTDFPDQRPGKGRWFAAIGLAIVVLVAAVLVFTSLDTRDGSEGDQASTQDDAEGTSDSEGADGGENGGGGDAADDGETSGPTPEIADVSRTVPDSADLLAERDGDLANLSDGDSSTSWNSFTFATSDFGGFASNLVLIMELEEAAPVSSITIDQGEDATGGSFDVLVNDSPSSQGAQTVGSGSFDGGDVTVDLDESEAGQYVMINVTELPEQDSPADPNLPYSLQLNDISVE